MLDVCYAKRHKIGYDKNLELNYKKLFRNLTKKISLIILANPNSPTGTIIPEKIMIKNNYSSKCSSYLAGSEENGSLFTNIYGYSDKVVIENINVAKKHVKPTQENPTGGIVNKEKGIHISNIKVISNV